MVRVTSIASLTQTLLKQAQGDLQSLIAELRPVALADRTQAAVYAWREGIVRRE